MAPQRDTPQQPSVHAIPRGRIPGADWHPVMVDQTAAQGPNGGASPAQPPAVPGIWPHVFGVCL